MTINDLKEKILNSDRSEWIWYDELGTWVFQNDLLISIKYNYSEERELFNEEWATRHLDKNAYKERYFIKYADNVVADVYAASVDGGRAVIPWPELQTNTITKFNNKIGEIVNTSKKEYYDYIDRCGLKVEL